MSRTYGSIDNNVDFDFEILLHLFRFNFIVSHLNAIKGYLSMLVSWTKKLSKVQNTSCASF